MNNRIGFQVANLINLLSQFVEGQSGIKEDIDRTDSFVIHYYTEIIRYWNRLNFILKKLTTYDKNFSVVNSLTTAKYLYIIFRYHEEKASIDEISNEIQITSRDLRFVSKLKRFSYKKSLARKPRIEKFSLNYAYPTFLINLLKPFMGEALLEANLMHMNRYDPKKDLFSFFFNTLRIKNNEEQNNILDELKDNKIEVYPDKNFSFMFNTLLENKNKIVGSHWYKSSKIIIADKASIIVASVLGLEKGEMLNDFCAAPGIKTTLLAQLTNNGSKIVASDFSHWRTNQMSSFLQKNYALSVFILNSDNIIPPIRPYVKFDRILIDAPCTGSGTLLSNPELKWRQNSNFLKQNLVLQTKLLNSGIQFLKPNGILVYSTCSLYAEEGELQILKFIDRLDPLPLPEWISHGYKINDKFIEGSGRLFPSVHNTKGFFIGKFKKKG
jgi:16S rRNA (cytosine967-C5)-methyltransferase